MAAVVAFHQIMENREPNDNTKFFFLSKRLYKLDYGRILSGMVAHWSKIDQEKTTCMNSDDLYQAIHVLNQLLTELMYPMVFLEVFSSLKISEFHSSYIHTVSYQ